MVAEEVEESFGYWIEAMVITVGPQRSLVSNISHSKNIASELGGRDMQERRRMIKK